MSPLIPSNPFPLTELIDLAGPFLPCADSCNFVRVDKPEYNCIVEVYFCLKSESGQINLINLHVVSVSRGRDMRFEYLVQVDMEIIGPDATLDSICSAASERFLHAAIEQLEHFKEAQVNVSH